MHISAKEEALRLKIRNKILFPILAPIRRKKLVSKDFTIISNNCWGGSLYESYGIKKMSPTVGMFFMPDDYIKFLSSLGYYLGCQIVFISPDESKYKEILGEYSTWGNYLIAKLDDIEIHMLHHHDEEIARKKWISRIKRINMNKLIIKFNDNNDATLEHIEQFVKLPYSNKLCFVSDKSYAISDEVIYVKQPKRFNGDGIKASFEPFGIFGGFDITNYINRI